MPVGRPPTSGKANDYLTRAETLELLKIKLQTLYAYVSRGWIRSVAPHGGKAKLYVRQDVERMRVRAVARSGHAPAAAGAMRWGQPIIQSTITEITAAGPRYRGALAIDVARAEAVFENVAALLWNSEVSKSRPWRDDKEALRFAELMAGYARLNPRKDLVRLLAQVALMTKRGSDLQGVNLQFAEGRLLIATMARSLGWLKPDRVSPSKKSTSIADCILSGFGLAASIEHLAVINAGLILSADHELAQSTFVARIAASAGADMGECIAAAILTQTGLTAARSYERAEDFLRGCHSIGQARRMFKREAEAHRNPPGFNHPLYPDGDPRAAHLVNVAKNLRTSQAQADHLFSGLDVAADYGYQPSLEVGLILLAVALGLPPRSASGIFIVGRSAGWVAHIVEQRLSGALLRPRADYAHVVGGASA